MFLSKYALSDGITEHSVERNVDDYVRLDGFASFNLFKVGRDVHHTREEAAKAANAMRIKRIKSLEKQLAELRAKEF